MSVFQISVRTLLLFMLLVASWIATFRFAPGAALSFSPALALVTVAFVMQRSWLLIWLPFVLTATSLAYARLPLPPLGMAIMEDASGILVLGAAAIGTLVLTAFTIPFSGEGAEANALVIVVVIETVCCLF